MTGDTLWWKFRGDAGLEWCIDSMDEGMVHDRENAGPLGCASSNWTQVFYDVSLTHSYLLGRCLPVYFKMFVNYTVHGELDCCFLSRCSISTHCQAISISHRYRISTRR